MSVPFVQQQTPAANGEVAFHITGNVVNKEYFFRLKAQGIQSPMERRGMGFASHPITLNIENFIENSFQFQFFDDPNSVKAGRIGQYGTGTGQTFNVAP